MTETELRGSHETRSRLRDILSDPIYRDAVSIIITKRRILERGLEVTNIDGSERQSLRLFNQRIGMESLILDLHEMTTAMPEIPEDPPATFGQEAAYRHLHNLEDANTQ